MRHLAKLTLISLSVVALASQACSSSDENSGGGGAAGTSSAAGANSAAGNANGASGSASGGSANNGGSQNNNDEPDGGGVDNPAQCPDEAPGGFGGGNDCEQEDLECAYENVTCTCNQSGGGGGFGDDGGTNLEWDCEFTPDMTECPADAPEDGAECEGGGGFGGNFCEYGGTSCFCGGQGEWVCFGGDGGFGFP